MQIGARAAIADFVPLVIHLQRHHARARAADGDERPLGGGFLDAIGDLLLGQREELLLLHHELEQFIKLFTQ